MRHFVEARQAALAALSAVEIASAAIKVCLIVDLQGKMWVLAQPVAGTSGDTLKGNISRLVGAAAEIFWGNKIWLHTDDTRGVDKALFETAWKEARPEPSSQDRVYVLDRHLSKDSWLGSPIEQPWPLVDQTAPIISFYSFKGGVGRTTALFALAVNLARHGKKVVVIDFDLEAPGAGAVLAPPIGVLPGLGVLDFLLDFQVAPRAALEISDFYHQCDDQKIIKGGDPIYVVPAGKLDEWYLEKLARINYEYLYKSAEANSADSPLHSFLKLLRHKLSPDVFLIDSRAGLHDLGGLSLSGIAHLQVLFGLDSRQSWEGISLALAHLGKDMLRLKRPQRDCVIVQSMVTPGGTSRDEEIKRFKENSFQAFSENYYDPADSPEGEWPLPDPESDESPHFPFVVSWSDRVKGYLSLGDIADMLSEGEYSRLCSFILGKVGRTLE